MSPGLRKVALIAHVTSSVGWFGAVAAFLVLAIASLRNADPQTARACYVAMELTTRWLIVPLAFAALVTGLAQSLGTTWGLFRHYWVLAKLVLTLVATALLLLHTRVIFGVADLSLAADLAPDDHASMRLQLVVDAAAALAVLFVNVVLSILKPRGLTRYGWRKQHEAS